MRRIGTKNAKLAFLGKNHEVVPIPKQGGTGTTQRNPIGTGTGTSGTDTTIQKVFGTGTTASKMPRFCSFAHLSLNSHTGSI